MFDPLLLIIIAGVFLLAGTVKGVIGLGLPTVSLGLLVLVTDLPGAMALMLVPSFVTNFWQGVVGGHLGALLKRLWLFFTAATASVWLGGEVLVRVDAHLLTALLGIVLMIYALISLRGVRWYVPSKHTTSLGVAAAGINGVIGGMTGSFVVPGVMYLQALGLDRHQLVQAMGILFTLSTLALGLMLGGHGLLSVDLGGQSMAGVLPALLGMALGQRLRVRMSEERFRRVFFFAILVVGIAIAVRNLVIL